QRVEAPHGAGARAARGTLRPPFKHLAFAAAPVQHRRLPGMTVSDGRPHRRPEEAIATACPGRARHTYVLSGAVWYSRARVNSAGLMTPGWLSGPGQPARLGT